MLSLCWPPNLLRTSGTSSSSNHQQTHPTTFCAPSSLNGQLPLNNAASASCSQRKNWATVSPPNSCDDCSSYWVTQLDPTLTTRSSGNSSYNGFRMVLASSGDMPLEALATLTDMVMEVASPSISSINVAPLTSEVGQLRSEVAQLREMIAALKIAPSHPHCQARSRSQATSAASPHSSSPAPLPAESPPSASLCWYHRRFGDAARKCTSPCSWTGNGPAGC